MLLVCLCDTQKAGLNVRTVPHGQLCSSNFLNIVRSEANELGFNSVIHLFSIHVDVVVEL